MIPKITFCARLIRKSNGVTHPAEFEAPIDQASAWIAAYEQFGLTHRILTIYPKDHYYRDGWVRQASVSAPELPVEDAYEYEYDPFQPEYNPYVWDGERIDATKTVLFHEHIAGMS